MFHPISIYSFLMFHVFRDVFVHQYEIHQLEWSSEVHFGRQGHFACYSWNSGFHPKKRKIKKRPDGSMSFSFSFEPGRCEAESVSAVHRDWCFPERWWFNDAPSGGFKYCFSYFATGLKPATSVTMHLSERKLSGKPCQDGGFLVGKRPHRFFRSLDLVCFYRDIIWFQKSWAL